MRLQAGARLGPYEVLSLLGVGGMGEVYRARDTTLNRDVALKILPEAFALDADRLARFKREAQLLAALNHPNIANIHGYEDADGVHALVMELVEGPTVADRIAQGPVPVDEALPIAKQIAEALEAAHEQGIIHRDLKPANIKLRPDGTVKVLDFGLAKAMEPAAASTINPTMSPTLSLHATMAGMLLGTAAYMAPEQARGKSVDKRADIWAFGCVLFEMLTGSPPFPGEDVSHILARVIEREPEWSALPPTLSPTLGLYLRRCLVKDPRQRLRDMGDVRLALEGAFDVGPAPMSPVPSTTRSPLWRRMVFLGAPMLVVAVLTGSAVWLATRPAAPQPVRFVIVPPPTQPLTIQGFQRDIAITPDGRQIVYRVGPPGTLGTQLAVRSLDELEARLLPGVSGIRSPFVSPDGHWIGYFEGTGGGELKKVSIFGGPAITLCKFNGNPLEASWGPDDTIIFSDNDRSTGLLAVSAAGGDPKVLTKPDPSRGELDHIMPFILPGGRAVLFTVLPQGQQSDRAQIAVLDLNTGQQKVLIRGGSDARYVDTGHLVYAASGTIRAVRFDLGRLEVTSDPVPVVGQVAMSATTLTANYVVSNSGTLVYVPGLFGGGVTRSVVWVNREGHEEPLKVPLRAYTVPRISPDRTRIAFEIRDQEDDIWVWDVTRETLTRVTFDPGLDQSPVWTPDSRHLLFSSPRGGAPNLFAQAADNTGTTERLTTSQNPQFPLTVTPDGTRVLFGEIAPKTGQDINVLTLMPSATSPRPTQSLIQTTFAETNAEVSPDGRWVAYQSNESGLAEIYVRPFPKVDSGHWQVSNGGGSRPLWAHNGRELFYYDGGSGALMGVTVGSAGAFFSASTPTKILDATRYYFGGVARTYDVADDSKRFLMIKLTTTSERPNTSAPPASMVVVVEHWTEELKQRVPTK